MEDGEWASAGSPVCIIPHKSMAAGLEDPWKVVCFCDLVRLEAWAKFSDYLE